MYLCKGMGMANLMETASLPAATLDRSDLQTVRPALV